MSALAHPVQWPHVDFEKPVIDVIWGLDGYPSPNAGIEMEFRLVYEGPLKSSSDRQDKHEIRQQFHQQLRVLWDTHALLRMLRENSMRLETLVDTKYGFRFLPLVSSRLSLGCGLDILFLRREAIGSVVHGGDIDNRIKILVDALKVPESENEIKGILPDANEDPFFCLLAKDTLISDLRISTDRLLVPPKMGQHANTVQLVIQVKVSVIDPSKTWVGWGL